MKITNWPVLNSVTKYPSILTYHKLGEKGRLIEELSFPLPSGDLIATEKIDGTNARIIIAPDGDFFIGSREELLYAMGDRIHNPTQGIVDAVLPIAAAMAVRPRSAANWIIVFGEVFGYNIGKAARHYTRTDDVGFRAFDIMETPDWAMQQFMKGTAEEAARWRDQGNQPFLTYEDFLMRANFLGCPTVPLISSVERPPVGVAETAAWLKDRCSTTAAAQGVEPGKAEGVILRSPDRKFIVKVRHEDYERTLRAR
jgi:hypothetical protein